jgi:glycosyltransferase involved in cell wall biosynthesis
MRILHVTSSLAPELGGPSKATIEMARWVAARGHKVEIFTTDWGLEGRVDVSGVPVPEGAAAIRYFPVHSPRVFKTSWPLWQALMREVSRFDVVHLHSLYLFHNWATPIACRRAGVPYILRPHGVLDPYIRRRHRWRKSVIEALFQNRVLREAEAIHYTAEEERRLAEPHAHNPRGVVVPLGIDLGEYERLPDPYVFFARYPETRGRRIVLFLSRLHVKKGLEFLVPAFARVAASRPDLHLVVAGPDEGMGATLRGWIRDAGLETRASIVGMLTGADKLAAFAAATVFVLPSHTENFGVAVLEAMAAGLPVLISDQVNIWREISDAGAGIIVRTETGAVEAGLARLLDHPEIANRMGQAGRRLAEERFAWPRVAAALEALYAEVASSRKTT